MRCPIIRPAASSVVATWWPVPSSSVKAANAARLREKLAKYVDHGTRVTPQKTRRSQRVVKPPVSGRDQVQAVRDWARQNGYTVSARGRIPKSIQDAFAAAH